MCNTKKTKTFANNDKVPVNPQPDIYFRAPFGKNHAQPNH